ncbi:hypothetical protein HPB49_008980 [Dermacentor silvarum]|uniref:Uncharacterized protein n=1 Tax=Dermacentor silvarum TaxID=543639 RepID=A0ACB8DC48_DERSI|nr:hypothetical protein HPB49_008980 [Dermacentor silvarum]
MPVTGKIDEFNADTVDWNDYRERVGLLLTVNDVPNGKKPAVFLTCCWAAKYSLLRSLLDPEKPAAPNLAEIFEALNNQRAKEAVNEYLASLKRLADDCKCGSLRDRMLREQIVSGTDDVPLETRLLESADLNLETAMSTGPEVQLTVVYPKQLQAWKVNHYNPASLINWRPVTPHQHAPIAPRLFPHLDFVGALGNAVRSFGFLLQL